MKAFLKSLVAGSLAVLARAIVRKYRPKVVMVTGSVGKTSTKDAIAAALGARAFVRASAKSFNSEFGVPFTIIGVGNPWGNPLAWLRVYEEALALLLLPNHYPSLLVLEVGADRPGDLAKILRIALPDMVVVTRLPEIPVHVEAYATPEAVREEEFVPAYGLAPHAPLVISSGDPYAAAYAKRLPVTITTFGFEKGADVEVQESAVRAADGVVGMEAQLCVKGECRTLPLTGAIGRPQLLAPAAAVAAAIALGYGVEDAVEGLASYESPAGRMRVMKGIGGSMLIDDSYNSSPAAAEESLMALKAVPAKRRIAVMGDMLELGRYSVAEHERIGGFAAEHADMLVTVGVRSRAMADAAKTRGLSEDAVVSFTDAREAAEYLRGIVREGDAVLVKGSQSIRMERVTAALLANPADTAKLVRQEREWLRR